jgi:hypothetical protein
MYLSSKLALFEMTYRDIPIKGFFGWQWIWMMMIILN